MSKQSDYSKLVEAGVNTRVAAELCNTFKTGKLLYDDLDPRAIEAFRDCPINEAIALLKTFTTTTNLNHVKNKSAYLCGMMKTQRQKNQQGKGGKPQRGVSPGQQMNRGGPSQGPRGPNMGPPSRNQMPRMPPPLMPQPPGQRMPYGMPAPNPQLPPGPSLQQGPIGNQGYGQPGNQGCGPGNQGYGPGNQGYGPGNQGYGPGNQGYGPGNQGYGPGNQGYGPGNQGYGPGNQGYGSDNQGFGPGNQGYGSGNQGFGPGNQGFGPGNQGYGPGNQGYGPGNQGYGQGNQRYGEPGNQGYGNQGNMQPGNQGFGGPSGQGYMQPGNQGFGSFGNQGGNYHPGECQGHGQQKPKDKNKKQKGKPKQGNNNQREEDDSKEEVEDGFSKIRSLLSEEPEDRYRGEPGDKQGSHDHCRGRGRGGRGQGRGKVRGRGGHKGQGQDGASRQQSVDNHQSSESGDEGSSYGSRANLSNIDNRGRGKGNRGGGRWQGHRGRGGQNRRTSDTGTTRMSGSEEDSDEISDMKGLSLSMSSESVENSKSRGGRTRTRGKRGQGKHKQKEGTMEENEDRVKKEGEKNITQRKRRNKEKLDKEIEDGDIPDVDDREVFKFIIKEFGGGCTYDEFWKKCTLFPLDSNIPLWFRKHSRRFHIFWNPDDKSRKQIVYLQPFYRDAKVCNKYNNRKNPGNCDESCEYFHICRKFVRGNCRNKDCPLSHSFKNTHSKKQKHKLGISDFTDADIKVVLNCNSPSVCSDYAYDNVCKVPNSERRCPHLHLCQSQVFGKCSDPCKFKKTHSIEQFHNKWVLASCHMKDWPQQRVFKSIYVPPKPSLVVDDLSDESDISQDEDDNDYQASNLYDSDLCDSSESLSSTTSDRSRSMSNLRDSMNSLTMGYDAGSKKGQPPSRKNRFKSTENIITGIVGRDDQNLSLRPSPPKTYDDDENIKERERRMMEKWKQEKKGYDADENIVEREKQSMEEWLRNQHRSRSSSDDVPVKPKAPPRPSKISPDDPNYQERQASLLKDESENTNICFYVLKDKCKNSSCKNYHLPSGVPYLWQIKMFDRWLSFTTEENETIEGAFCNLQDVVSTEVPYQKLKYSCHIHFPNQKAIIYDVGGLTAIDGDSAQGCDIRRLTTASFAEKKMTVPCYLTQWRWYWRDDSRKCNIYEKDVFQFTLEKKYLTKQRTYMFSRDNFYFMYQMDFQDFTQKNLDTNKVREILRRPTFVSRDDVKNQKYPESIPFPIATSTAKPMHFNTWDCAHDFELVDLEPSGREYTDVVTSFHNSMDRGRFQIKYVYRIQNRKLWSEYDTQKRHMTADAEQEGQGQKVDERDLFHGTDSLNTCRGICTNNFDFRISGRNATLYGEGSYFAIRAKIGHSYTKADSPREVRFLFRAKVLVGQFTKGDPTLKRPPTIPGKSHKLFDSCVDKEQDPTIFVVFDRNQCYPEYLFMYTDNETLPPVQTSPDSAMTSHDLQYLMSSNLQSFTASTPLVYPPVEGASTERSSLRNTNTTGASSVQNPSTRSTASTIPTTYKEAEHKKRDESCSIQ